MICPAIINTQLERLATLFKDQKLLKNVSWMLAAEGAARASRLVTIVVLGFCLSPVEYGIAMLAIVCHELMRVFTRAGSGAKVIQCEKKDLPGFASNAVTLQWMLCLALTGIQIATAQTIANYYNAELTPLLQVMALSNLLYPIVTVKVLLVQRSNNMRYFALASASSIMIENFATALFALFGMGVMAVAVAKLCSACCWVIFFLRARVPHYAPALNKRYMKELTTFSGKVLASELIKSLRLQIDSLFAARMLSPELFGLYSFAKSAGIGLSQSLSSGFLSSLYPYLCHQQREYSLDKAIKKTYLIGSGIAAIFILQAACAPIYVNLLFDVRWHDAAMLVTILCLSAVPSLTIDTTSTIFRAQNQAHVEIYLSLYSLLTLLIALTVFQPETAIECALLVTITSITWLPALIITLIPMPPNLLTRAPLSSPQP